MIAVASVAELMHQNLFDVFNERDPERRLQAVALTYSESVIIFYDPEGSVTEPFSVAT
jgi:hypothetical protein